MELLIESSWYHVTWKVKDFFQLPSQIGYTLNSPKFFLADDSYCLQLKSNGEDTSGGTKWRINLLRLTSVTERNDVCRHGLRLRIPGQEIYTYVSSSACFKEFPISIPLLEEEREVYFPDDTFTWLCFMRLAEQSSTGSLQADEAETSNRKEKHEGLPGQSVYFNSCWRSTKMELAIESPCLYITLKVPNFSKLPTEIGYFLDSHEFRFEGDSYCLRFYPNGDRDYDTARICYQLVRLTSNFPERNVSYKIGFGVRLVDLELDSFFPCCFFNSKIDGVLRSEIEGDRDVYIPDDTFTLVCSMLLKEQSSVGSLQSEESETFAEKEQRGLQGVTKLQTDYRQLLHKGQESDACFVVSGKEFHIHRCVLRARSAVFESMFSHEMAEKDSGRVVIDDIDPESFGDFLEYLYTGRVEAGLSDDNALGIYSAADKYDLPTLMSECIAHMRRTLSVDSFCDIVTLALRHNETDLLQQAIQFFKNNLQSIIVTVKWQQFVIENGISANELFIKALVPGKQ